MLLYVMYFSYPTRSLIHGINILQKGSMAKVCNFYFHNVDKIAFGISYIATRN